MNRSRSSTLASSVFTFEAETSTLRCLARIPFRTQVRKSAIGSLTDMHAPCSASVHAPSGACSLARHAPTKGAVPHQLDLTTPGICPASASSRKQMRHSPKSRRNPRGRPQRWQRVYARTLNFGARRHFSMIDFLAIRSPDSRLPLAEGHAHEPQQLAPFLIGLRTRDDGDVHAPDLPDLVEVDLGEDDLLGEPHRVVAAPVERPRVDATEVADARDRDVDEAVVELPHPGPAQSDRAADRDPL